MVNDLATLYARDLSKLADEIGAFQHEECLWMIKGEVKNSAGNLCLHLVGNLRTYIGKNLGKTDYSRDRDAEFSVKNIPRAQLIRKVNETREIVINSLKLMTDADLAGKYIENVLGYEMTNGYFLAHLLGHLSYHLGQINYLRRIVEPGVRAAPSGGDLSHN
jgi:uncharacterized damage-inducible protein DinB